MKEILIREEVIEEIEGVEKIKIGIPGIQDLDILRI